jgi:A/G-specific adenine glycosylase
VLVSEVMLQQTQAARVAPAFESFLRAFPSVERLAAAPLADVLRAWAGLGYNRRAVALFRAARAVVRDHGGAIPADPMSLRTLPGVGPYTAAAVASMAYGTAIPAVDTNVRRVVARAEIGRAPETVSSAGVATEAARWIDPRDPGGWNQAVMDLGREVCRPVPRCDACPLAPGCRWRSRRGNRRATQPLPRRQQPPPFDGSTRQLRGRIVRHLRSRGWASLSALSQATDRHLAAVADAVRSLASDGVVHAGPAALQERPGGRVRL